MNLDIGAENLFRYKRLWGPLPYYPKVESYVNPSTDFISVAGPCSVESAEQIHTIARELGKCGVKYLRGGVFRAGTYPTEKYGYGWVDEKLIAEFARAAHENGMKTIIEILDYHPDTMINVDKYADCYQVGARQMQNYQLLKTLKKSKRRVFLKRNMGSTLDEFLGAAEYLLKDGHCDPVLIERGSSSFLNHVRWEPSISMIPAVHALSQIPIIIDASHSTGRRDLVEPIVLAGIAAGANGYLVETHMDPEKSLSDPDQSYPLDKFKSLKQKIDTIHGCIYSFDSHTTGTTGPGIEPWPEQVSKEVSH